MNVNVENGSINLEELTREIQNHCVLFKRAKQEIGRKIIGQEDFIDKLLISLITGGHTLIEGVPGLAKTETIKALADVIGVASQRIQFTPDLLPADLVGTQVYNANANFGNFEIKKGPLFTNLVLADEINRAPAKVHSALLEAMAEKQITIAEQTFDLAEPFVVLATQNPIDQEGTYSLPEAQMDRFMMKINISYPKRAEEKLVMNSRVKLSEIHLEQILSKDDIFHARQLIDRIYVDEKIQDYILDIVGLTRKQFEDSKYSQKSFVKDLDYLIDYGVSPRASIALLLAAKVHAYLEGRAYLIPQDIKNVAFEVLRHRIGLSFEAEAEEKNTDDIIKLIFDSIEVP